MLYTPIKSLGNNFNQVQLSFFAIERVFDVMDMEPSIKDKPVAVKLQDNYSKIELKDVCFEYKKRYTRFKTC